ncbi:GIY-YIG nuclease family protein [Gracilimonas sp.]|uniref:GIY-YIG nuclease family protein n=1 Tax=Gracilimonas sp. TaxID=1974203 RepID=UPI0032ECF1BF
MTAYFTYITTNRKKGVLYTGMTNNLIVRVSQHKEKVQRGFTSKYNADQLVWFEEFQWVQDAIIREKEIKGWRREKKIALIEESNPDWEDLYPKLLAK